MAGIKNILTYQEDGRQKVGPFVHIRKDWDLPIDSSYHSFGIESTSV